VALGLARIELGRRDWTEAHRLAAEIVGRGSVGLSAPLDAGLQGVIAAAAAGMKDWPLFDVHCERVAAKVEGEHVRDVDIAWCLRLAEARADAAGQAVRARRARRLADVADPSPRAG
jgi:hypothetical protein